MNYYSWFDFELFCYKVNVNSYVMCEDGTYKIKELNGEPPFNIHKEFYKVTKEIFQDVKLF